MFMIYCVVTLNTTADAKLSVQSATSNCLLATCERRTVPSGKPCAYKNKRANCDSELLAKPCEEHFCTLIFL